MQEYKTNDPLIAQLNELAPRMEALPAHRRDNLLQCIKILLNYFEHCDEADDQQPVFPDFSYM